MNMLDSLTPTHSRLPNWWKNMKGIPNGRCRVDESSRCLITIIIFFVRTITNKFFIPQKSVLSIVMSF